MPFRDYSLYYGTIFSAFCQSVFNKYFGFCDQKLMILYLEADFDAFPGFGTCFLQNKKDLPSEILLLCPSDQALPSPTIMQRYAAAAS